jgi:hypothetical protein
MAPALEDVPDACEGEGGDCASNGDTGATVGVPLSPCIVVSEGCAIADAAVVGALSALSGLFLELQRRIELDKLITHSAGHGLDQSS